MPKIVIDTKFDKDDRVFLMYNNGIVEGRIHSVNIYNGWGIYTDPADSTKCIHQKLDDALAEIGDEPTDTAKPILEYNVEILHPPLIALSMGKPIFERVIGSTRMFRKPGALIDYLKRKFERAYETKINPENKRGED